MKARYSITNYPGLQVMAEVQFDNDTRQSLDFNSSFTVGQVMDYCRQSLAERGASSEFKQTWNDGCPTWVSDWVQI